MPKLIKKHLKPPTRQLTKSQRITMLEKKLDRVVQQAEACGKKTKVRKALMFDAELIRDMLFRLEPRSQDVTDFMASK